MTTEQYNQLSTRSTIQQIKDDAIKFGSKETSWRITEKENYAIADDRGRTDGSATIGLDIEFDSWGDFGIAMEELESTFPLENPILGYDSSFEILRSENGPITVKFWWTSEAFLRKLSALEARDEIAARFQEYHTKRNRK